MVSLRKAKKAAKRTTEHWRRVFPPKPKPIENGFIVPCQEVVVCERERAVAENSNPTSSVDGAMPPMPQLVVWILRLGWLTIILGGLTMTRPQWFQLSVFLVYIGLLMLGLELYFEPALRRWPLRIGGWLLILAAMVWYSIAIVFVSAPLSLYTMMTTFNYTEDSGPAGIRWRPYYTELELLLTNPTAADNYDDLNVLVRPDLPLAEMKQLSQLFDFSVEDRFGMNAFLTIEDLSAPGKVQRMDFLATNAVYKVHCGRIPPNTTLKITMALVNFNPARQANVKTLNTPPVTLPGGTQGDQIVQAPPGISLDHFSVTANVHEKDGGDYMYWYGSTNNSALYLAKPTPHKVFVNGSYIGANRIQKISQEVLIK